MWKDGFIKNILLWLTTSKLTAGLSFKGFVKLWLKIIYFFLLYSLSWNARPGSWTFASGEPIGECLELSVCGDLRNPDVDDCALALSLRSSLSSLPLRPWKAIKKLNNLPWTSPRCLITAPSHSSSLPHWAYPRSKRKTCCNMTQTQKITVAENETCTDRVVGW